MFLHIARAQSHSHIFMRVTYTHGSSVCKNGGCTCTFDLSISPSPVLMIHLSLLFLHDHFETTPDCDSTDAPIHMILPYFPVLEAQNTCHSAHASRSLATWQSQTQTQVMSPSSTRSLQWTMTRCSSTIRTTILRLIKNYDREH